MRTLLPAALAAALIAAPSVQANGYSYIKPHLTYPTPTEEPEVPTRICPHGTSVGDVADCAPTP